MNGNEDDIFEDPRFKKHASTVINMVDTAIPLLEVGDTKTLFAVLHQLGARHASYKVEQHHYPIVGEALILTLEVALGGAFTLDVVKQWVTVAGQNGRPLSAVQLTYVVVKAVRGRIDCRCLKMYLFFTTCDKKN